ncbi:MAG TPA: FTR1 family protein [Gaiellaceae bacterium]|nr:FTR1 family protein [Gaiellaceae bacterium]
MARKLDLQKLAIALGLLAFAGAIALTVRGVRDPSEGGSTAATTVVFNSAVLVFREGLEAILVLAAVTASFRGANASLRRPIAAGGAAALAATVATWFVAVAVIGALGGGGLHVQAATGVLAVVVLLVVMNWFFHRVYWTGWISHHNKRRRRLLAGGAGSLFLGFALLGFTAVYREGFEVVLFLQNLRLRAGTGTVLEGVAIGLAGTVAVGALTFVANAKLPYKKLLVWTGVLLGVVLVVMVGESAQELQLAGWLSTTGVDLPIPDWAGLWFAVFPTVETLAAQALAAALVLGSYFAAEYLKVRRPRARGERVSQLADRPPELALDRSL